jgi:purine-nucleoside phosphorylase
MTPFETFLNAVKAFHPKAAVILGSGLGPVVDQLRTVAAVAFGDVPGFAAPTVHGHAGRVLAVEWHGVPVLVFRGRMHYYEGHPWDRVTATVRLAHECGAKTLLLTNAAGGLHPDLNPGDLMAIHRHLPLVHEQDWCHHANRRPWDNPYAAHLVAKLQALSSQMGKKIVAGVYAGLTGPCYETPAEIRALAAMGADAVGMSTVREALAGAALGMNVAAVSCITNKAAGLSAAPLDHNDVQEVASRSDVVGRLARLVREFLAEVAG